VATRKSGVPLASAKLTLQAKRFNASSYQDVGTATETFVNGTTTPAVLKVKPSAKTAYRWHYSGNDANEANYSSTIRITVATKVTAKPADKTVHQGGKITISGFVTPAHQGRTVTLFRHFVKLNTGTVHKDGSYSITVNAAHTGIWKLYVTIGATAGNLAGSSPTVRVTVS
jgi:hypothetical protein